MASLPHRLVMVHFGLLHVDQAAKLDRLPRYGSATTLLLAAASTPAALSLTDDAIRALRALGVTRATRFEDAARDVVRAWDRQLHEGLRTGGAA